MKETGSWYVRIALCAGVVGLFGAGGCGHASPDEGASNEQALYSAAYAMLWNNNVLGSGVTIPVCFQTRPVQYPDGHIDCKKLTQGNKDCLGFTMIRNGADVTNNVRSFVQSKILGSWPTAANITLTGWGECPVDPVTQRHVSSNLAQTIVIRFSKDPFSASSTCSDNATCQTREGLGAYCEKGLCKSSFVDVTWALGKLPNAPTVIQYNWPAMADGVDGPNAIHEFGHALGFDHEWRRSDFTPPPGCNADDVASQSTGFRLTSSADPASIMNYCAASNTALSTGDISGVQAAYGPPGGAPASPKTFFADVDGNGKADAITVNSDSVTVRTSDGACVGSPSTWISGPFFGLYGNYFADVTGDGKADAIVSNPFGVTVRRAAQGSFSPNETWISGGYSGTIGQPNYFADVTGDGRADAIVAISAGVFVRRNQGNGFSGNEMWTSEAFAGSEEAGLYFADVTGDGKADAIISEGEGIYVRRANAAGTAFNAREQWIAGEYWGDHGLFFADATGDGKADAIVVNSFGTVLRRSTGSAFNPNEMWISGQFYGAPGRSSVAPGFGNFFADLTGDGKADGIVITDFPLTYRASNGSSFLPNVQCP